MSNIYGTLPVIEALRAGRRQIEKIFVLDTAHPSRLKELIAEARRAGVPLVRSRRDVLERLACGANHQGVIAVASAARYADAEDIISSLPASPMLVLLDEVEDPHNLGAVIRTAECAGATAVFVTQRHSAGLTDTVAKTSAGAVEYLPVARVVNLASFVETLKEKNIWVVGVEAGSEKLYTDWDYSGATALVFGSEGRGLRRLVRERCDVIVSIPVRGHITSLNVSVAAGIVLFEAVRQRLAQLRPDKPIAVDTG